MQDKLKEILIAIQINRAPAEIPAKDGDAAAVAVLQVNLLRRVLVETEAEVGRGRAHQGTSLPAHFGERVVNQLGFPPWNFPKGV
jgi:hypothetical protein